MPNRFVQAIRSGRIDSVDDLKTAFRELALATHPDMARARAMGHTDPGEAFIAVRAEYETALANFERHRFGASMARRGRVGASGRDLGAGGDLGSGGARAASVGAAELWGCLSLMLKRGFPKEPRHEKEILRYEYARWRLRGALQALGREAGKSLDREAELSREEPRGTTDPARLFDAAESELIAIKKTFPKSLSALLSFLRKLADEDLAGHPAMRVALVRDLDALRIAPGLGAAARNFVALLAERRGIGPTLGAR
ncbi:MAG TPA: hypothetical protein VMV44_10910 [Rectinemataceae bacterium]|nr:hypothetical protein [Rectinemataceae bacterium]